MLLTFNEQSSYSRFVELVEPAKSPSPIDNTLKQKNHLYHYCIEVPSLEEALSRARKNHTIITQRPKPAVLFGGRKVAFVWAPNQYLIEFLES